jgi:hypothetical protein
MKVSNARPDYESVLDAQPVFVCFVPHMKIKFFAAFAGLTGLVIIATGCISTVSDTKTVAISFAQDNVTGRYQRSVEQVYNASVAVIQHNGVLLTEFIPHDTTNTVRSLQGKVNERNVWIRVESVDPQITAVTVQARSTWGNSDIDLAHELEKEVALQLAR